MLYTVTPLEKIYSNRTESVLGNTRNPELPDGKNTTVEYRNISIKHGNIYVRKDGSDYEVEGILSTDMADYLNRSYMPGARIKDVGD
ncbi:MAG: YlzJ-like protein [Lachnoclostridium sp.]|jgi:hypothetical protein